MPFFIIIIIIFFRCCCPIDRLGRQTAFQGGAYRQGLITGYLNLLGEHSTIKDILDNEAWDSYWYLFAIFVVGCCVFLFYPLVVFVFWLIFGFFSFTNKKEEKEDKEKR